MENIPDIYNFPMEDLTPTQQNYPNRLNRYTIFGVTLIVIGLSVFAYDYDLIPIEGYKKVISLISNGISHVAVSASIKLVLLHLG